ncbi:MAG: nucleotide pyrophosphohydrolase [Solirubrobacterales bacterium]
MAESADLERLRARVREFAAERGWDRVRTLKDLSLAIGIEAGELQELFLWVAADDEAGLLAERRGAIEEELADVFLYCLALADRIDTDLLAAANAKMDANERRFPRP